MQGWRKARPAPEYDAHIAKAMEAYSKSIELKPDDPGSHNNYALALAKAKKFPEMQAELKKAADLDPQNGGKYYYNLGAMLVNSGQAEAGRRSVQESDRADADVCGRLLSVRRDAGRPGEDRHRDGKVTPVPGTVEAFQKYLELQPNGQWAAGVEGNADVARRQRGDEVHGSERAAPRRQKKK